MYTVKMILTNSETGEVIESVTHNLTESQMVDIKLSAPKMLASMPKEWSAKMFVTEDED